MNKYQLIAAIVGASALASTAACAGTIVLYTSATFSSETSGLVSGDFSGIPTPDPNGSGSFGSYKPLSGYSALKGASFSTSNLGGKVNVDTAGFYGPNDLQVPYLINSTYSNSSTEPSVLTITLPYAVTAFSLDFGTVFASTTATFDLSNGFVYSASNTAVATGGHTKFLGFVSTSPFETITLTTPAQTGGQAGWVVESYQFGASAPESATWAMMLAGFAALGFAGYRRTKQEGAVFTA